MKNSTLGTVVFIVLLHVLSVWSYSRSERESEILKNILIKKGYNPDFRPGNNESDPVLVRVNMYIRNIGDLDETKMEYSVQVTFRQEWKDDRLSYKSYNSSSRVRFLTLRDTSRIWTPDAFFTNENSGYFHNIVMPNVLVRIMPDGNVLYSVRLSLTLKCPMDFKYYPMDHQTCSIVIASYAYLTEDVVFLWKKGDPVQVSKNLIIRRFTLERFFTDYCTSRTNTGEYSCLRLDLQFRRTFTQYFMDIYLPTIILVVLSWLCFALDHKNTTARVVLYVSVFTVFSIKMMCLSDKVPSVSHATSYSIWITACLVFLIAVMAKLGYDAFLQRRQQRKDAFGLASDDIDVAKTKAASEEEPQTNIDAACRFYHRLLRKYPSPQQKSDVICLIVFPVAFGLFNIFYWSFSIQHYD